MDVNVENYLKIISKLVKTKPNSKHCIGYFDKTIRLLVLIIPKKSGYVKTLKVKKGDKDKNKINVFPYRRWKTTGKI